MVRQIMVGNEKGMSLMQVSILYIPYLSFALLDKENRGTKKGTKEGKKGTKEGKKGTKEGKKATTAKKTDKKKADKSSANDIIHADNH